VAPSRIVAGGRRLPPTVDPQHYFFFFLVAFFFIDSVTSSPFWDSPQHARARGSALSSP